MTGFPERVWKFLDAVSAEHASQLDAECRLAMDLMDVEDWQDLIVVRLPVWEAGIRRLPNGDLVLSRTEHVACRWPR